MQDYFSLNFEYKFFMRYCGIYTYMQIVHKNPSTYILLAIQWISARISWKNPIALSHDTVLTYILLFIK